MARFENNVAMENRDSRVDILQKVTGTAKYTADQFPKNMIYAKFIRFPYGKGKLEFASAGAARKVPGVLEVEVEEGKEANYPGDRLGHVVAESIDAIEDAIEALDLEFSNSRPRTDADLDRMYAGPPEVDGEADAKLGQMFTSADKVVEATYRTQVQTHSCLETHGGVVDYRGESAEVWGSTQGVNAYHDGIKGPLGLPGPQVVVHNEYVGGGFGSKFGPGAEGTLAANMAKKYKRPCKVMLDRKEEHTDAGNRPGSIQYMKMAVNKDGKIVGGRIHCASIVGFQAGGGGVRNPLDQLYRFGHVERTEEELQVNFHPPRAFRAPGWPQGVFAIESMMDEMASAIGMDPIEFRKKNETSERRKRQLDHGAELIGWNRRLPDGSGSGRIKRGLGVGGAYWPIWNTPCEAECVIGNDGMAVVRSGVQDIGTGTFTVVTDVACETLQLERKHVTGLVGNSSYPPGPASGGSVVSRSVSPAVRKACQDALQKLSGRVAREWKVSPREVEYANGTFKRKDGRTATWVQACAILGNDRITGKGETSTGMEGESEGLSDCVQFADVEVDTETGIIRVKKIVAIHSAGWIVNRLTLENQICGGVIQGVSYALFENRIQDRNWGSMLNTSFINYKIPGSLDVPDIVPVIDAVESDTGVRPIGEPATIPTSGAIANAVANAIGARVRSLPMTPDKVLAAIDQKGGTA